MLYSIGMLDTVPPRSEFMEDIQQAIHQLPEVLCDVSYGIDADYLLRDRVSDMKPESRLDKMILFTKMRLANKMVHD